MQPNCGDGSLAPKPETIKVAGAGFHGGGTRAVEVPKKKRKDCGLGWLPGGSMLGQDMGGGCRSIPGMRCKQTAGRAPASELEAGGAASGFLAPPELPHAPCLSHGIDLTCPHGP